MLIENFIYFMGKKMLLDKKRKNLNFKPFYSHDLNLFFKSKSFPLKTLLKNKMFPEIFFLFSVFLSHQ